MFFMSFVNNLQRKPIKTREKILWGSVTIVAVFLFSFLIWQQRKQLSSLNILPSENIPKPELQTEEIKRLKSSLNQLKELEKKKSQIPGARQEELEELRAIKQEDLEKLSEEDKKSLEELTKKIQGSIEEGTLQIK